MQVITRYLPPAAGLEAVLQIRQLSLLESQVHQFEKKIDVHKADHPMLEAISQIPGVGKVSGWSILAEKGDIHRFGSDKNFASYCRLVPGSSDSGGKR